MKHSISILAAIAVLGGSAAFAQTADQSQLRQDLQNPLNAASISQAEADSLTQTELVHVKSLVDSYDGGKQDFMIRQYVDSVTMADAAMTPEERQQLDAEVQTFFDQTPGTYPDASTLDTDTIVQIKSTIDSTDNDARKAELVDGILTADMAAPTPMDEPQMTQLRDDVSTRLRGMGYAETDLTPLTAEQLTELKGILSMSNPQSERTRIDTILKS